ncbi:DNA polymerase IV [Acrasis kona]|uniref:DNA polymerase IV n=1 Tax=Acrasis kona TaxID=1008807 RepID=A0AAW2ZLM2_9EUKA
MNQIRKYFLKREDVEASWLWFFSNNLAVLHKCYSEDFYRWIRLGDHSMKTVDMTIKNAKQTLKDLGSVDDHYKKLYEKTKSDQSISRILGVINSFKDPKAAQDKIKIIITRLYEISTKVKEWRDPVSLCTSANGDLTPFNQRNKIFGNLSSVLTPQEDEAVEVLLSHMIMNMMSNFYRRFVINVDNDSDNAAALNDRLRSDLLERSHRNKFDLEPERQVTFDKTRFDILDISTFPGVDVKNIIFTSIFVVISMVVLYHFAYQNQKK